MASGHLCEDLAYRHGEPRSGVAIQRIGNMFWMATRRATLAVAMTKNLRLG